MEIILKNIQSILLIILILVQLVLLIYLFIINHKRFKEDKKFWANLDEEIELSKRKLQLYLEEHPEEEIENEQQAGDKK